MKIVSWNMKWNGNTSESWSLLREMDADVALLQECVKPPRGVSDWAGVSDSDWQIEGKERRPWRSAVVQLSERVEVEWIDSGSVGSGAPLEISRPGTLEAAVIRRAGRKTEHTVASMYAAWERYSRLSKRPKKVTAVASAHRVISDLTRLVGGRVRLIAAGDMNVIRCFGTKPHPFKYLDAGCYNYGPIFRRMEAIGVPCVGPFAPEGGRAPTHGTWKDRNMPVTYYTPREGTPANATQQLDYVFATENLHGRLHVTALNEIDEWGPSDHCRILIDLPNRKPAINTD